MTVCKLCKCSADDHAYSSHLKPDGTVLHTWTCHKCGKCHNEYLDPEAHKAQMIEAEPALKEIIE